MRAILAAFQSRVAVAQNLLAHAHSTSPKGAYLLAIEERSVITNACFLQMFIALEEFYEAAFIHYATGRMSTARWRPTKYARPVDADHANRMLIGAQRFVDWSRPDVVRKLAGLYFQAGEPFETALASSNQHLQDMKTVRNATAHMSSTTNSALDALQSRWTGTPVVGTTPYDMLLSANSTTGDSFLTVSESTVSAIALAIANWK